MEAGDKQLSVQDYFCEYNQTILIKLQGGAEISEYKLQSNEENIENTRDNKDL